MLPFAILILLAHTSRSRKYDDDAAAAAAAARIVRDES